MGLERSMLARLRRETHKRRGCVYGASHSTPLQSVISETARPYGGMQLHEGVHISMVVGCCKHMQGQYRPIGVAIEMVIRGKPHYTVDDQVRKTSG